MHDQLHVLGVAQPQGRKSRFSLHSRWKTERDGSFLSAQAILFNLIMIRYWVDLLFSSNPSDCNAVTTSALMSSTRKAASWRKDSCRLLSITSAEANSVLPPIAARGRPPALLTEQKSVPEVYAPQERVKQERKFRKALVKNLFSGDHPYVDGIHGCRGDRSCDHGATENLPLDSGLAGKAGDQHFDKEKEEKLQRILEMFLRKDSRTKGTKATPTKLKSTQAAFSPAGFFVDREKQDELKAARMQRFLDANEQRTNVRATNAYKSAATLGEVRDDKRKSFPKRTDTSSEDTESVKTDLYPLGGIPEKWRELSGSKQSAEQHLTREQMEKIRTGIRFNPNFDLDRAAEEARKASTLRLVWNITYIDERLLAQKLHEKMDAYLLRHYIALLKKDRRLQSIPLIGNSELLRFLRSLLTRDHIYTTKTDEQIVQLFSGMRRHFGWIPSLGSEEGQETITREYYSKDEL